jgi:nucleotide-binding universal stress UspA family protein
VETIAVGVDGSENANKALEVAAAEAALRGARLRLVCAWEVHPALYTYPETESIQSLRRFAEQIAGQAVAFVQREHPELECEGVAIEGHPAEVLLEEAESADLIVVGNRGHGGFASLVLGSISHQVVQHATCPVLVVPHPKAAA